MARLAEMPEDTDCSAGAYFRNINGLTAEGDVICPICGKVHERKIYKL